MSAEAMRRRKRGRPTKKDKREEEIAQLRTKYSKLDNLADKLTTLYANSQNSDPNYKGEGLAWVGRRVACYWKLESEWYFGTIIGYSTENGKYGIEYDDGETMWEYFDSDMKVLTEVDPRYAKVVESPPKEEITVVQEPTAQEYVGTFADEFITDVPDTEKSNSDEEFVPPQYLQRKYVVERPNKRKRQHNKNTATEKHALTQQSQSTPNPTVTQHPVTPSSTTVVSSDQKPAGLGVFKEKRKLRHERVDLQTEIDDLDDQLAKIESLILSKKSTSRGETDPVNSKNKTVNTTSNESKTTSHIPNSINPNISVTHVNHTDKPVMPSAKGFISDKSDVVQRGPETTIVNKSWGTIVMPTIHYVQPIVVRGNQSTLPTAPQSSLTSGTTQTAATIPPTSKYATIQQNAATQPPNLKTKATTPVKATKPHQSKNLIKTTTQKTVGNADAALAETTADQSVTDKQAILSGGTTGKSAKSTQQQNTEATEESNLKSSNTSENHLELSSDGTQQETSDTLETKKKKYNTEINTKWRL